MKRRDFLALAGATAAAWPLPAIVRAQQAKTKRMGFLFNLPEDDPRNRIVFNAFWTGAAKQGWNEKNLLVDYRFNANTTDAAQKPAAELVSAKPDVLFCSTTPAITAVAALTKTIPIVFAYVNGLTLSNLLGIQSCAHPGGNITGLVNAPDDSLARRASIC